MIGGTKEAEISSQEGPLIKLKLKEKPDEETPVFIYRIEKIENPHLITQSSFKKWRFLLEKANYYLSLKDYPSAERFYKEVIDFNPQYIDAYHNLGICYFLWGKYKLAIEYLEKAIELSPYSGYSYLYLGIIYSRLENYPAARHYLKLAENIFKLQEDSAGLKEARAVLLNLPLIPGK